MNNTSLNISPEPLSKAYFRDYLLLSKFRLSTTVVGTTVIAYFLGLNKVADQTFNFMHLFALVLGGMLVTAAANGFNQIIEKDYDKLMSRTQNRPLADNRMTVNDAMVFSIVCAVLGLLCLLYINGRVALLSLLSIFIYALCYTPLKKQTPWAVFVGAIPGALPPAIGWVAVVGNIDEIAIILFLIQFFWQFPHFWAIAWMLEEDYRKAGYTLLPSYEGRTKKNAMQIIWYSLMLLVVSIYPISREFCSLHALWIILPAAFYLIFRSVKLYSSLDVKDAKSLMFASLLYMPAVLLSYLL